MMGRLRAQAARERECIEGPRGERVYVQRPPINWWGDRDIDCWDVDHQVGPRVAMPVGYVHRESEADYLVITDETDPAEVFMQSHIMRDTWKSVRHTMTGTPKNHGKGFATRDEAALSLYGAMPYKDEKYDHSSLSE